MILFICTVTIYTGLRDRPLGDSHHIKFWASTCPKACEWYIYITTCPQESSYMFGWNYPFQENPLANIANWKMAKEIVSFPINSIVIFHTLQATWNTMVRSWDQDHIIPPQNSYPQLLETICIYYIGDYILILRIWEIYWIVDYMLYWANIGDHMVILGIILASLGIV